MAAEFVPKLRAARSKRGRRKWAAAFQDGGGEQLGSNGKFRVVGVLVFVQIASIVIRPGRADSAFFPTWAARDAPKKISIGSGPQRKKPAKTSCDGE